MIARTGPSSAEAAALPSFFGSWRLAQVAFWTAWWAAVWGAGRLLGGRWDWTVGCRRRWAAALLRAFRVRVEVQGHLPRGGYLLALNHLGYLDVLVVAAILPVRFVAKHEVQGWPVWGPLARWTGTLFVDRERKRDAHRVASAIGESLSAGESVAIFPEGTSSAGETVLPYRAPLFEGAAASGAPVVPAALRYAVPEDPTAVRDRVCWWGEMEFAPHLMALATLPPIEATLTLGTPIPASTDRRSLASESHARTERMYRTKSLEG